MPVGAFRGLVQRRRSCTASWSYSRCACCGGGSGDGGVDFSSGRFPEVGAVAVGVLWVTRGLRKCTAAASARATALQPVPPAAHPDMEGGPALGPRSSGSGRRCRGQDDGRGVPAARREAVAGPVARALSSLQIDLSTGRYVSSTKRKTRPRFGNASTPWALRLRRQSSTGPVPREAQLVTSAAAPSTHDQPGTGTLNRRPRSSSSAT